jgi:hypothetical protein
MTWQESLTRDPLPTLCSSANPALRFFVRRDLLGEPVPPMDALWELPEPQRLLQKQQPAGCWRYPGQKQREDPRFNYSLLETFRILAQLVHKYGLNRDHPAIRLAAKFVFSCQTDEGDVRGILGNQLIPYYHAAILESLIRAGYADDPAVERGLTWLLTVRQEDGGWIIPLQAVPGALKRGKIWTAPPVPPDRVRPFSHLATGMVLRALAAHPAYRSLPAVQLAGERLKSRFFRPDRYNDRRAADYWLKFRYPFWWNDLLSALDSLGQLAFSAEDPDIRRGLDWFVANQQSDGLWPTEYDKAQDWEQRQWVGLAICRMLRRFSESCS